MRAIAVTAILVGLLAGCGQKGPLHLPPDAEPAQEAPAN